MAAISYSRGWQIEWNGQSWVYTDTKDPIKGDRPCKRCGKAPTINGHDSCLGFIPGAKSVCCGHGIYQKTVIWGRPQGA